MSVTVESLQVDAATLVAVIAIICVVVEGVKPGLDFCHLIRSASRDLEPLEPAVAAELRKFADGLQVLTGAVRQ